MSGVQFLLLLLGLSAACAGPTRLLAALQDDAEGVTTPTEVATLDAASASGPAEAATSSLSSVNLATSGPFIHDTGKLPDGFDAATYLDSKFFTRQTFEDNRNWGRVKQLRGVPKSIGVPDGDASRPSVVSMAGPSGATPAAWCPNPNFNIYDTRENYDSCIILLAPRTGEVTWRPFCSVSFVNLPAVASGHVAITAGHCISDGKGSWVITRNDVICCAYNKDANSGRCPTSATYNIRNWIIFDSYHKQGNPPHDIALISATSPVSKTPGKWAINNWNPSGGSMTYWVYGYPQQDSRLSGCDGRFNFRRVVYGVSASPRSQPTTSSGAWLWGSACGGNSGGPVYHVQRQAITSVMSRASTQCESNGWGSIWTAAIMGIPASSGGQPGLTDNRLGVDVWYLRSLL